MFVVNLTYTAPLAEIDRLRDAHMEWVKAGYADGVFIASGAKRPRTGGVILARGTREALDARLAEDPFTRAEVADYEVIDFAATSTAAGLEALKD
ncbi:YciI family protein [Mesorhizobium sp. UC22_110]|uniref:YciI family protein n=1 Tax=unclassified Mesorhizobium TaxID=325217 RepID=UPI003672FE10